MNRRRRTQKFFTSFFITLIIIVAAAAGSYAALRATIRPPSVDEFVEMTILSPSMSTPRQRDTSTRHTINTSGTDSQEDLYSFHYMDEEPDPLIFQRRPNVFTFLLYGLDEGNNADAVLVASFDADTRDIHVIGFPRDTRVDVNRRVGLRKLVNSYAAGRAGGRGHDGGVTNFKYEISTLIGFEPDFYVGIRERAFVRLINSIGGVEVTVPFHMVYDDPCQNLHINLPAGRRVLNGEQALHFARFRQANEGHRAATDIMRTSHHQQIITAAMNELMSPRTITRIPELVRNYRENVNTDLADGEIAWFIEQISGLHGDFTIHTHTIPIESTVRQGWYELPNQEELLELVNRTINPFFQEILPEMQRFPQ